MADHDLWRKNIPEDFQGKMGENWDDDVYLGPIYWSAIGIAGSVALAFVLCWFMIPLLDLTLEEPSLSPLAEANERRLPPTPWLQPKPEMEMDAFLEESAEHMASYGWTDQITGVVHIPVEKAIDMVAASYPVETAHTTDHGMSTEETADDEAEVPAEETQGEESHEDGAEHEGTETVPDHSDAHADSSGEAHG